ncbi:MAG: hypothetical protein C5B48_07505 [Candidatus Rokuibacteriota bacterium]|nr:MAG: hypothetical protein C5B48_07505 [Candidatus Rokubacteria bacterium]
MTRTKSDKQTATILIVPVAVAIVLMLFAWPASRQEPRDLPIGVVGPVPEQTLAAHKGAFEVHRYAGEAEARRAIKDRDVYGAFVATGAGAKVLTASAASASVAQLLQSAAGGGAQAEDVVPASKDDPHGSGLASSVLPMVLAGILVGLVSIFFSGSLSARAAMVLAGSVLAGFAAVCVAQWWFGVVEHNWAANWAAFSLVVLAIASVVSGFEALLGAAGIAVGSLTMMLIGNPFSGVSSAPEMLPRPVGDIGQLMPPGAGGNMLRSTAFFDGADAGGHLVVLLAWIAVGAVAMIAAAVRARRAATGRTAPAEAMAVVS